MQIVFFQYKEIFPNFSREDRVFERKLRNNSAYRCIKLLAQTLHKFRAVGIFEGMLGGIQKMKAHNIIIKFKSFAAVLIFVLAGLNFSVLAANDAVTFARISKEETVSLAVKSLSKKLQNDLMLKSVSVKFSKIEGYVISGRQIGIKGEGTCRLDGETNDLPLNFDVKIDVGKRAATDVKYVFLNMEGATDANSTLASEDVITQRLLKQIKDDYKTENIVIAIDSLEEKSLENGEKEYVGTGEIRLNSFNWKKINFDVKGSLEKAKVSVVKYQIK